MKLKGPSFVVLIALLAGWGISTAEVNAKNTSPKGSTTVEAVFETTLGSFTLELYPEKAPKTVANFLSYVDQGFYDYTLFHRVIPGFVIQGGGFAKGMQQRPTRAPIENESRNGLRNTRGMVSMARTRDPHSATSQFFINITHNQSLDVRGDGFGYAVFGKVTTGMEVIDKIVASPTKTLGRLSDVPEKDIVILSAKRKKAASLARNADQFVEGEHYTLLDKPVPTRDRTKVEVVEAFSYGCSPCYSIEPMIAQWQKQQASDVDFWRFPAVWNEPMKLYARAFYASHKLNVVNKIHQPLFTAIVVRQKRLSNESELADFFALYGVDKKAFSKAFNSPPVEMQVKQAEASVRSYNIAGAPEIIVNGKYRVDRMRAGGLAQMVAVVNFLVDKERDTLRK